MNIDTGNTVTLDAGTYPVPSVSFNAQDGGVGVIRPFLVRDAGGGSYETIWVGAAVDATGRELSLTRHSAGASSRSTARPFVQLSLIASRTATARSRSGCSW